MELDCENMGQHVDFQCRQESWSISLKDGDSNAIILPGKRSKKKGMNQSGEQVKKKPELGKSQKRRQKKLEEDKAKALRLSKSMETIEKYKIQEDAFSLLRSSRNIGQTETMLEKRQSAVKFSKAGLEMPCIDQPFKRRRGDDGACESESELEVDKIEATPSSKLAVNGGDSAAFSAQVANTSIRTSMLESSRNQSLTSCTNDGQKSTKSIDKADENLQVDISSKSNLLDCPIAPISVVHVSRPNEVEEKRKDLPIVMMEQEIMEAINYNSALIICGETGCGKTTQVPQFLYEAGFGSKNSTVRMGIIGVTQPRRVAVLATAKRVAYELGVHLGKEVGFQVRHDKMIGNSSSIKFMTDGILLREVQSDISLKRYSVIILDEAHERSLNTDILIGMLSRVVRLRQNIYEEQQQKMLSGEKISPESLISPLKLILMSATLRVEDFVSGRRLFPNPPPIIEVPARQFPVTIHFSKRTEVVDYIGQAYKKILAIHKRLPQGGILVFVTGQREVEYLCRKLRNASKEFVAKSSKEKSTEEAETVDQMESVGGVNMEEINEAFEEITEDQSDIDEDESDSYDSETQSELEFECDDSEVEVNLASLKAAFEGLSGKTDPILPEGSNPPLGKAKREEKGLSVGPLCVLPLYAMLPAEAQLRVFEEIKEGERLVVVATNVAETSLTIPGIRYVVDTGREKVKHYNPSNGMESYEVQWISKASASQRAGRAGRTGPGHCYRLYSSAVFTNLLPEFSVAEISKIPVDGVVLFMKSIGISKVSNFPFATPPEATALAKADRCLKALDALDSQGRLTPLGRAMAQYPMSPRHSRMLLTVIQIMKKVKTYARANLILGYTVAAAAALCLSNPFVLQFEETHFNIDGLDRDEKSDILGSKKITDKQEKLRKKKLKEAVRASRAKFSNPSSDALTIAYALQCFELSENPVVFCNENALHMKTVEEMSKLRKQLLQLVFNRSIGSGLEQEFSWAHGTMDEVEHAWRVSCNKFPLLMNEEELLGQAICAGWADRVAKRNRGFSDSSEGDRKANAARYQACVVKETVFLHRWSSVSRSAPEFLVYNELLYTKRPFMHGVTSVKSEWLVKYASSLCSFSAPLTDPKPYYDPLSDQVFCWVTATFGPHLWQLPLHSLPISNDAQRVAVFAYALLEGHVLPCLKSVRACMAAPPASILRPEGAGQWRVGNLVGKLKTRSRMIDSCAVLRETWNQNPRELYSEILEWFQEKFRSQFESVWKQMQREILLEPRERFPKRLKEKRKE